MNKKYNGANRRRVFRLKLPPGEELKAVINGQAYSVVEVAEFSLMVDCEEVQSTDGKCSGTIYWSDESESEFRGEIGRLNGNQRVVVNIRGISMPDVIGQQRRMLLKYPAITTRKAA